MIKHILVPLDGSSLAECVLPYVLAVARAVNARITLLHVLERPRETGELPTDPLQWHLKKIQIEGYLNQIEARLQEAQLEVTNLVLEGVAAERIIEYATNSRVDLIALSTHGYSGLSGWNVSSVVQKIILRAYKSTLLVRAYNPKEFDLDNPPIFKRLFVGLDSSARAEMALPIAIRLSKYYQSELILGTVIRLPELFQRFPPSDEDQELIRRISNRNQEIAERYFDQLSSQFSFQGINVRTRLATSDNVPLALHNMVKRVKADLALLVAHGRSAKGRWPYGSAVTSFISYGTTSLLVVQDLSIEEIESTRAEAIAREQAGH